MTDKQFEEAIGSVETVIGHMRDVANPDTLEALLAADVEKLESKFRFDGVDGIDPAFRDRWKAKREAELIDLARNGAVEVLKELRAGRQTLEAEAAAAKPLRSEAQALGIGADQTARYFARLLDTFQSQHADQWIDQTDMGLVLDRYEHADESGDDRAFVRIVEARLAAKRPLGLVDGKRKPEVLVGLTSRANELVTKRQDARVPAVVRERLAKIADLEARHAQAAALLKPTHSNIARSIGLARRQTARA